MRQDEIETYRLYARLPVHRRRIAQSQDWIREASSRYPGEWAIGLSGGKDSCAMLDQCIRAGWRGPCLHFYYRETPPENTALAHTLAGHFGLILHVVEVPGAFDVFDEVGHAFTCPQTEQEKKAVNRMLKGYKSAVDDFVQAQGWRGVYIGLRADESRARKITLRKYSPLYQSQNRASATCCPLAWWSGKDVWAALISSGLPWLDTYDTAEDREIERSEMVFLACDTAWAFGQALDFRRRYPDRWARLIEKYPELSSA